MPGLRWRLWPVYSVERRPWVQVPAGEIGMVIAQVGQPLPIGAKSAGYKKEVGNFTNLRTFIEKAHRTLLTKGCGQEGRGREGLKDPTRRLADHGTSVLCSGARRAALTVRV